MTYNAKELRLMDTGKGSSTGSVRNYYRLVTADTSATVEASGYFNGALSNGLNAGDVILATMNDGGTPTTKTYTVTAGGASVTIAHNAFREVRLPDMSNKASDAAVVRYVPTFAGSISKIYAVLNAALATGNATLQVAINGTNVTGGLVTETQSGSAAGNVASAVPTALNTFAAGDVITVTGGGASTATSTSGVTLQLTPA